MVKNQYEGYEYIDPNHQYTYPSSTVLINKQKNTITLTGQNIASRTEEYSFKDGIFSVDISGVKHDYYLKGSEAYKNALKQYGYK